MHEVSPLFYVVFSLRFALNESTRLTPPLV